jgi:putative membrane protein
MNTQEIYPHRNYLKKLRIAVIGSIAIITLFMLLLAWPIAADGEVKGAIIYAAIWGGLGLIGIAITLLISAPYYRSLKYEIMDEEVIVRAGIVTKSVKHVPYRTVTNLVVKRGILDRLFGLGTLNIQTAGMSGSNNTAEESLVGLENVQEVYDTVVAKLRRYRGGMAPTQADNEAGRFSSDDNLSAILVELVAIRSLLDKK